MLSTNFTKSLTSPLNIMYTCSLLKKRKRIRRPVKKDSDAITVDLLYNLWLCSKNWVMHTTQKKFRISCAFFFIIFIIEFKLMQTLKGFTDQGTIFRGCFLHDHLQFQWNAIRSKWHNFNCLKTTFWTKKCKTSFKSISFLPSFEISLELMQC